MPVPESGAAVGEFEAVEVTVKEPVNRTMAVGRKTTLMVQEAEGARVPPQVLVCVNPVPAAVMLEMVIVIAPVFCSTMG